MASFPVSGAIIAAQTKSNLKALIVFYVAAEKLYAEMLSGQLRVIRERGKTGTMIWRYAPSIAGKNGEVMKFFPRADRI